MAYAGSIAALYSEPPDEVAMQFLGPGNWFIPTEARRWLRLQGPAPLCLRPERLLVVPVDSGPLRVEGARFHASSAEVEVRHVPGHCPGSLCFLDKKERVLFGGDVLFAGGVGRWDLPGGDGALLFRGIKEKLFALPDDVTVLPGHGPATKMGIERETNPYVGVRSDFGGW